MLSKIKLLFSTVRRLRFSQILYQIYYRLFKVRSLSHYGKNYKSGNVQRLVFCDKPPVYPSYVKNNIFTFLNLTVNFHDIIDWNYMGHGKLWNYNLQYCNYVLQKDIGVQERVTLLEKIYSNLMNGELELEPYPASLRSINLIRFLSQEHIKRSGLEICLYKEIDFISKRLEYHILGNHLLENAFSLLMGGGYFSNAKWLKKAEVILKKELDEQILSDGAHFELSPMYHQIILFRVLECIDWYREYDTKSRDFLNFLREKASIMLKWLNDVTFKNGDIPHFNDCTNGISFNYAWLREYSSKMDIIEIADHKSNLGSSGYRMFRNSEIECIVDLAEIGPSYQPGHGHADALSFIMYVKGAPFLIEQGTSTYQIGKRRDLERSTSAHNTVTIGDQNQSEVWGGFRVGKRAKIKILADENLTLKASHDGYIRLGFEHVREFVFDTDKVTITDEIINKVSTCTFAHFHFAAGCEFEVEGNTLKICNGSVITFTGAENIIIDTYELSIGFNLYATCYKAKIAFTNRLITEIII